MKPSDIPTHQQHEDLYPVVLIQQTCVSPDSLGERTERDEAALHAMVWVVHMSISDRLTPERLTQSVRLGVLMLPIWYQMPRGFLESCWASVHVESLKKLVLISGKQSEGVATDVLTRDPKGQLSIKKVQFPSSLPLYLGCLRRGCLN